jgi:bacteriorhodopsin
MIDPIQAFGTKSLLVPTHSATPSVYPEPTVKPDTPYYQEAGNAGSITLWIVFVIMLVSTLAFVAMAWRVTVQKRLFHTITAFITLFATISYFAMATGSGVSLNHIVKHIHHNHTPNVHEDIFREVYWARYVDWSLTTPLLLLDLAFLAGMNGADILVTIVADLVMVLTGLFAAYGKNDTQKWGYYAMGCVAYIVIVYQIAVSGRRTAALNNAKTAKFFITLASFTLILWTAYPIVWGIGDGARLLSVDAEIICYAVLDVLAKPVFGLWLLIVHARSASAQSLEGFWAHGLSHEGALTLDDDGA